MLRTDINSSVVESIIVLHMKNRVTLFLLVTSLLCTVIQPLSAKEKDFISLAYVSLPFLKMHELKQDEVYEVLNQYNWNGISDVALIGGVFTAGQDGSLVVSWNKKSWPEPFEGLDYKGDSIHEQQRRDVLCSKGMIKRIVKYFKDKDIDIWLSEQGYGWLTGGSLGKILEDHKMTLQYAKRLNKLARQLGCVGLDFDWEFPPTARQAEGYRELMCESKRLGMKVSVCAIQPTVNKAYQDNCFPDDAGVNNHEGKYMKWEEIIGEEMVDHINVMQYLGYNSESKAMDVNVKYDKMKVWEQAFPKEFTSEGNIKMLCGIGFYSFMLPEARAKQGIKGKGTLNYNQLYEKYGEAAYTEKVVGGEHAVWTTDDVREIVKTAKARGWRGVFTWLVSHDFTLKHPLKYNRQQALAEEVEKIWEESN